MQHPGAVCLTALLVAATVAPLMAYWSYVDSVAASYPPRAYNDTVDVRLAPLFSLQRMQLADPYGLPLPAPPRPRAHWRSITTVLFGLNEEQATVVNGALDGECRTLGETWDYTSAQIAHWRWLAANGYRLDWRVDGMPVLSAYGEERMYYGVPIGRADGPHVYIYNHIDFIIALDGDSRVVYVHADVRATETPCGEARVAPNVANETVAWSYTINPVRTFSITYAVRWRYYQMVTAVLPPVVSGLATLLAIVAAIYVTAVMVPTLVALARRDSDVATLTALKAARALVRSTPRAAPLFFAVVGRGVQLAVVLAAALAGSALSSSPWDATWTRALVILLPTTSWIAGAVAHALIRWFYCRCYVAAGVIQIALAPMLFGIAYCVLIIEDVVVSNAVTTALIVVLSVAVLGVDAAMLGVGAWWSRCCHTGARRRAPDDTPLIPRLDIDVRHVYNIEYLRASISQALAACATGGYAAVINADLLLSSHAQGHATGLLVVVLACIVVVALNGAIAAVRVTVNAQRQWLAPVAISAANGALFFAAIVFGCVLGSSAYTDGNSTALLVFVSLVAAFAYAVFMAAVAVAGAWLLFAVLDGYVFAHVD